MNPKFRQSFYYLSSVVTALVGLVVLWGGLESDAANNLVAVIAGLGGLFGATGPALAGKKVGEQTKDGTLDVLSPADQIAAGAQQLQDIIQTAQTQANQAKDVLTGVLGGVPVLSSELENVLNRIKF